MCGRPLPLPGQTRRVFVGACRAVWLLTAHVGRVMYCGLHWAGMAIPIGKLDLYVGAAGFNPG